MYAQCTQPDTFEVMMVGLRAQKAAHLAAGQVSVGGRVAQAIDSFCSALGRGTYAARTYLGFGCGTSALSRDHNGFQSLSVEDVEPGQLASI